MAGNFQAFARNLLMSGEFVVISQSDFNVRRYDVPLPNGEIASMLYTEYDLAQPDRHLFSFAPRYLYGALVVHRRRMHHRDRIHKTAIATNRNLADLLIMTSAGHVGFLAQADMSYVVDLQELPWYQDRGVRIVKAGDDFAISIDGWLADYSALPMMSPSMALEYTVEHVGAAYKRTVNGLYVP